MSTFVTPFRFSVERFNAMIVDGHLTKMNAVELIHGEILEKNFPVRTPHRFSVSEFSQMIERGYLGENDNVELIHGEIVEKMVIGSQHAACVNRLNKLISRLIADSFILGVQNPIELSDSRPEPDITVLRLAPDEYSQSLPKASDALLLIEVAETSLEFDREVKGPLYAQNGIPEYWIVNLVERVVEVFHSPTLAKYQRSRRVGMGETLTPILLPNLSLSVDQMVGLLKS